MELEFIDRVAQLARRYLHQARPLTPTADEFVGWVDAQALTSRPALYKAGPQAVWALFSPSFHEHVLTERGHPFPAFLVGQLSPADYLRWVELYGTPTLAPDELYYWPWLKVWYKCYINNIEPLENSTTTATAPKWLTWAGGLGLLGLAYWLQERAHPLVIKGSVQQQYQAHLTMTIGWVVGILGLCLLGVRGQHRLVKQFVWLLTGCCCLVVLTMWFQHRHQRAVPLGGGAYQIINP